MKIHVLGLGNCQNRTNISAVFMILAPFSPMPHVLEKLIMLKKGTLTKPIDIFDLFFHLVPTIILLLKIYRSHAK